MPTVVIDSKISLATREARSVLTGFHKAIVTGSTTVKTLNLLGNMTGSLDLKQSEYLIVLGPSNILNITLKNTNNESINLEDMGFLMIHASNLEFITIQNTSNEEQSITLIF